MTRGGALEVLPLHVSGMYSQPAHVCVPRGLGVRKNRGCLLSLPTVPCSAHGSSSMTSRFCQPNWTSGSRDKDKQARQRCALRCIQYSSYACARCPPSWSRSQGSLMMSQARIGLRMTRTHTTRRRAGPNSSMLRGCSNDCHPTPRPVAFRPINRFLGYCPTLSFPFNVPAYLLFTLARGDGVRKFLLFWRLILSFLFAPLLSFISVLVL